jgi:hypothetical protein
MDGVQYWRAWAHRTDGDIIADADRIGQFYLAMTTYCGELKQGLNDEMPEHVVKELGMDR